MSKAYSDLVKQAESAVASVTDPELRRTAFEKVLDDLLSSPSDDRASQKLPATTRRGPAKKSHGATPQAGPRAYIREMKADGFFAKPKTISEVRIELANRGHHIPTTSLSGPLQKLCQDKELRRQKTTGSGDKTTFVYSNW